MEIQTTSNRTLNIFFSVPIIQNTDSSIISFGLWIIGLRNEEGLNALTNWSLVMWMSMKIFISMCEYAIDQDGHLVDE